MSSENAVDSYIAAASDLTAVADAIRYAGSTSAGLAFPDGMVSAARALKPNLQSKTVAPSSVSQTITPDGPSTETEQIATVSGSMTAHTNPVKVTADLSALVIGETYHVVGSVRCTSGQSGMQSYTVDTDVTFSNGVSLLFEGSGSLNKIYLRPSRIEFSFLNSGDLYVEVVSLVFTKTTTTPGYTGLSSVTVNAIPPAYVIPSGTFTITSNGTYNISGYESVEVNVTA